MTGAYIKRGLAYSYQNKREEAVKEFDAAIAISPDATLVLYAYDHKILCYVGVKYSVQMRKTIADCQREYEKIKASESFRKDLAFRQQIQNSYAAILDSYCISLYLLQEYGRIKKIISDFITEFESETDFGQKMNVSADLFFHLSQAFRGEKNFARERYYLEKSLYWAKQGKFVYDCLYLRLAAHALIQKKYDQALSYCDSGLAEKQVVSNRNYEESHAILLFAKSKIYEKMGQPEIAAKYAEKARKLDPSPLFHKKFDRWWIKK